MSRSARPQSLAGTWKWLPSSPPKKATTHSCALRIGVETRQSRAL
jgi:hypothetical protein